MMGKAQISIRFITLRPDGLGGFRPRYIPGSHHRDLGLKGEDLRNADGRWFTLDECARWSLERERLVAELDAAKSPKARKAIVGSIPGALSVGQLFDAWFKEPRMNGVELVEGKKKRQALAHHTVRFYRNAANQLEALDDGAIWNAPAAAISSKVLAGVLHKIEVKHGLATARGVRVCVGVLYGWAKGKGLVSANPARGLEERMPVPAPRIRYGSIAEMKQLIAAADLLAIEDGSAATFVDVGDAIVMGLWTGQRQADRLELTDYRVTPDGIVFQQSKKRGQPLLIPEAPELKPRLVAARTRRAGWKINYPHVLLDERLRRPWTAERYRKAFAKVRAAAVAGIPAVGPGQSEGKWKLEPMPSLADFHDQDLRDTAVTWLALAGCDKILIASITGHSLASIDEILKHYLGLHPELAKTAIGKLVAWFDSQQQGGTNG